MKLKRIPFLLSVLVLSGIVFGALYAFFITEKSQRLTPYINEEATARVSPASDRLTLQLPSKTGKPNKRRSNDEDSEQKFTKNEITLNEDLLAKGYKLTTHHGEMTKVALPNPQNLDQFRQPRFDWIVTNADQFEQPANVEFRSNPDWFFAWIQVQPEFIDSDLNTHPASDIEHFEVFAGPENIRRARIPSSREAVQTILAHPAIVGIGLEPNNRKLDETLLKKLAENSLPDSLEVYITLMTTERVPKWIKTLEKIGVDVHRWDSTVRVLVTTIPAEKTVEIVQFDFVQAVEEIEQVKATLDSATLGSGVDSLRTFQDSVGLFAGNTGADIPIGLLDTGLNLSHRDISTNRSSICGESFVVQNNGEVDSEDLWIDYHGHGTHITGILAGNGYNNASRAGAAPGVQHIRFAKVLDKQTGTGPSSWIISALDYLAEETACIWEGSQSSAVRPLVVNISLNAINFSSEPDASSRKLDWVVWSKKQLYVVGMGNSGRDGYSLYAGAKNSISVGNLTDSNLPQPSSSWGPTYDERFTPNIATVGTSIYAARGNGSRSGYDEKSGTSMSSPHVAGIASLLMQTVPEFQENPALVRAQLMASAVKPHTYFEGVSEMFPKNNTGAPGWFTWQNGMGAVSARTAILQNESAGWVTGSATSELNDNEYAYIEIEVPENTKRLDIVLTWDEPPNDYVRDFVISDIDLYFGPDSDCDPTECADYSSTSSIDNVEYLIIENPTPGTQRISIVPFNVYQFEPRVAVAWKAITGAVKPQLSLATETNSIESTGIKRPELNFTVTVDSYLATGTYVHFTCRSLLLGVCDYWYDYLYWQPGSYIERRDGTKQSLTGLDIFAPLPLGEILAQEDRDVRLVFPPEVQDGSHQLYIKATSMNSMSALASVDIVVDDDDLPEQSTKASNDDFRSPIKLTEDSGELEVDLLIATSEPSESWWLSERLITFHELQGWEVPSWTLSTSTNHRPISSLWFSAESDKPETLKFSLEEPDLEEGWAFIYVTTNDSESLTGDYPIDLSFNTSVSIYLQPHQTYYVWIGSIQRFTPVKFTLKYEKLPGIPNNDMFASRTELSGESGFVSGFNEYATTEPGEPGAHKALSSMWYEWTAPENSSYDFWEFTIDQSSSLNRFVVQVYDGDELVNLRLLSEVSLIPEQTIGIVFPVEPGETYKIKVASWENSSPGQFLLSWKGNTDTWLMDNDMFANAIEISDLNGQTEANQTDADFTLISPLDQRTIEPNEPVSTESHSLWWKWTAPSEEKITWRLSKSWYNTLSVFRGSELPTLEHISTARELVLDTSTGDTYSIALHRKDSLQYEIDRASNQIIWGLTPENDSIANASSTVLDGTSGSSTLQLEFATSSADESIKGGIHSQGIRSSVWATWMTPENFDRWMKFSLDDWEEAGLNSNLDQHFLGVHLWNEEEEVYDLIASTDRSYIISGRAEAQFKPIANQEYLIQIALRNNGTLLTKEQTEITFTWEESDAPSWLTGTLSKVEIGDPEGDDMLELSDPTAVVSTGREGDKLLVSVEDGLLLLGTQPNYQDLEVIEMISTTEEPQNSISDTQHWDIARQVVYSAQNVGFGLVEGVGQSQRNFVYCEVEDDYTMNPTQVISHPTGRYLYKIEFDTIAAYRLDGPCEITLLQVISADESSHSLHSQDTRLDNLWQMSINQDGTYLYGVSEEYLITIAIDSTDGNIEVSSALENSNWFRDAGIPVDFDEYFVHAPTVLDSSGEYLFVVGRVNPNVAILQLGDDPATPKPLSSITKYFLFENGFFPSHIRKPRGNSDSSSSNQWNDVGPEIESSHNTNHVAVDVFTVNRFFVATWDKELEELYISDWASDQQPDRFGNEYTAFTDMNGALITQLQDGSRAYVVLSLWIDSIHQFERISGAHIEPLKQVPPYDEYIVRLVAIDVSPGEIKLGSKTISACEAISEVEIDDIVYTVESSKWQNRSELGADWEDVDGTVLSNDNLCPLDPSDSLDYRMVVEVIIDNDVSRKYSSNVMSKSTDE